MKKLAMGLSAATALTAVAVVFASPALASPSAVLIPQCGVHVNYNGADVNVDWC